MTDDMSGNRVSGLAVDIIISFPDLSSEAFYKNSMAKMISFRNIYNYFEFSGTN
jgi:hypothetical protein